MSAPWRHRNSEAQKSLTWLHPRHVEIVEAIIAGDGALAQLHLRRYIDSVKREQFSPVTPREEA